MGWMGVSLDKWWRVHLGDTKNNAEHPTNGSGED